MPNKTVLDLLRMKAGSQKITMITAYDYTMARLVDSASVDMVLVGDSVGMVFQGHSDTLSVTLDDMIYHSRCVSRGLKQAHLTVDLPFMSYQISPAQALESAGRLVQEGRAQSVKLEGGAHSALQIKAIVDAGIPVVGHVGLTPQSIHALGGYRVQGRGDEGRQNSLKMPLPSKRRVRLCWSWKWCLFILLLSCSSCCTFQPSELAQGRIVTDRFWFATIFWALTVPFSLVLSKGLQNLNNP